MKTYRIALIGCGQMGSAHLDDIYYREDIRITYVCDLNAEKASAFKRKYHAENILSDYRECISREDVDIVIAATYPSTHLSILKKCIKHGKHLLCEKPITADLEEGKEFVRLVKANPQIKVLVGHILRHNTTYNKVREMIREKGERVGVAEAKKHLAWYCHGMEGAAAARGRLMQAASYDEMAAILQEIGARHE